MKIKHKQPLAKNCGIYALANILNEDCFIKEENLLGGDDGLRITELNDIIKKEGFDFFIDPIYVDRTKLKIPEDFELHPLGENKIIPGIMIVQFKEDGLWHCIGFRLYSDKTIQLFDSLKEETFFMTWNEISKFYYAIEGIYCFSFNDKNIEGYLCLE